MIDPRLTRDLNVTAYYYNRGHNMLASASTLYTVRASICCDLINQMIRSIRQDFYAA